MPVEVVKNHVAKYHSRDFRQSLFHIGATATLAAAASLGSGTVIAAENYSVWSRTSDLILDTSPSGADVPGTESRFPILLRLTSANFVFAQARGKGQDIRFSAADGSHLDYQIERWDSAQAHAEVWIHIPVLLGNTAGQAFKMHWGNATAQDSSDGPAVFSFNYAGVWHMGATGANARPNSAPGGNPAQPVNFASEKSREGIIAKADELDGTDDYLDIGDGYQDFSAGLSFSVWAYPKAVGKNARFFELGNGVNADNILLTRDSTLSDLRFDNYNPGSTVSTVRSEGVISLNAWQLFAVDVSGSAVKIYKNGAIVAQANLSNSLAVIRRSSNFLGKSNRGGDNIFQGLLDEPQLGYISHSDNWYKLCYQNQKASQNLVTLKREGSCTALFKGPADTTVSEGASITLSGKADCASGVSWSVISGPAPRILDPETRTLSVSLPRVLGDTVIVYRFSARYGDSTPFQDVRVRIQEAVPEPAFTLPAGLVWNGREMMTITPAISNLPAITASNDNVMHWAWTLNGIEADTASVAEGLTLKSALAEGNLEVGLCLDNSGPVVCKTALVTVALAGGNTTGLRHTPSVRERERIKAMGARDAAGRLRTGGQTNLFGAIARPIP
ncbi:MAG: DUF2341 domain-containing protein [Fibrobacteria bacterium]